MDVSSVYSMLWFVPCKSVCRGLLFMDILNKKKKRLLMLLGFISKKHLVVKFKFKGRHGSSRFTQMRKSYWRTLSAMGGLLGRVLPFHWQLLPLHLQDEGWPSMELRCFDRGWGTACSGAAPWSLDTSASDKNEASQPLAAFAFWHVLSTKSKKNK